MNVKTSIVFLLVLGVSISLLAENNAHAEIPMEIQVLKWQGDEYWDQIQDIQKKIATTNSTEVKELYEYDLGTAQANLDDIISQMNAIGVPTVEEQLADEYETAGSCSSCPKILKFKGAYTVLCFGI